MSNNVDNANKDVNDYFLRYAASPMSERPYHHGNLRAALLQEAERTVRENGTQALSLRELARAVGVSHAAPRRHFPDRQALLDALADTGFARLGTELKEAADGAGDAFEPRMHAIGAAYVRFATRDAALLELMYAAKHRPAATDLQAAADRAFAVVLDLIHQGQEEGALERDDPERVGFVLFATIHGIASLVTAGVIPADRCDELVHDAIAQLLRGARAPV